MRNCVEQLVLKETAMTVERTLRLIAGTFILLSLALGHYVSTALGASQSGVALEAGAL